MFAPSLLLSLSALPRHRLSVTLTSDWPSDAVLETLELLPAELVWPFIESKFRES